MAENDETLAKIVEQQLTEDRWPKSEIKRALEFIIVKVNLINEWIAEIDESGEDKYNDLEYYKESLGVAYSDPLEFLEICHDLFPGCRGFTPQHKIESYHRFINWLHKQYFSG